MGIILMWGRVCVLLVQGLTGVRNAVIQLHVSSVGMGST